ncbi:MAG TPA: hypothetical protein VIK53_06395 [Verrucomicrobiae bacterium]
MKAILPFTLHRRAGTLDEAAGSGLLCVNPSRIGMGKCSDFALAAQSNSSQVY